MGIYTRTGDKGSTALFGGSRVPKQDIRVDAYGTVDEANAHIGKAKALAGQDSLFPAIHFIQNRLFSLAAELASDEQGIAQLPDKINDGDIAYLEHIVDQCMDVAGPQKFFIIPGRDPISAEYHIARTVIRRAERRVLTAAEHSDIRPEVIKYLNRLSDTLFACARVYEHYYEVRFIARVVAQTITTIEQQTGTRPDTEVVVAQVMEQMQEQHKVSFASTDAPTVAVAHQPSGLEQTYESNGNAAGAHADGAPYASAQRAGQAGIQRTSDGQIALPRVAAPVLTLAIAQDLATFACDLATKNGDRIVVVVMDAAGDPVLVHRMDDSLLISVDVAMGKAYSAVSVERPSAQLQDESRPDNILFGIQTAAPGKLVTLGGGLPIFIDGTIVGSIGISGGPIDGDIAIAKQCVERIAGATWQI